MNQSTEVTGRTSAPNHPAVAPWLLILFLIVLLGGGGYLGWYFWSQSQAKKVVPVPATVGTKTYTNNEIGFKFDYPGDWTVTPIKPDLGDNALLTVEVSKTAIASNAVGDISIRIYPNLIPTLNDASQNQNLITLSDFLNKAKYPDDTLMHSHVLPETIAGKSGFTASSTNDTVKGLIYFFQLDNGKTFEIIDSAQNAQTSAIILSLKLLTSTSSASTGAPLTYTNEPYKFTLTFPATWVGYKMKPVEFSDSLKTYYINVLTTDKNFTGDSTASAGFFSPFAITVYTLDQWAKIAASEGPKDTLIAKTAKNAFGWSHANGTPPADFGAKEADIAGIIASFKTTE